MADDVRISVIVPVLNEETTLGGCLAQFAGLEHVEVIVSDGGSTDGTGRIIASAPGVRLVRSRRGRGPQLNAGAASATGDVLLFLHADCRLPPGWPGLIGRAMSDPAVVGGRFRLELSERTLAFRLIAWASTLRSRHFGITYGDQGILVRRSEFDAVGGFPGRLLFEDSEFCTSLSRRGRFVMLDGCVTSSTRRWRTWGVARTVASMWVLRLLYVLSVSDERLNRWYRAVR